MRGKIQAHSKEHKMQKLLDKEIELEAQLQRYQDNLDLFEEYYLQNSWRTGNIFLGWPICTYAEITEFINRPRAKKNTKPYVEVADHQKIFSLSSVSSRPFINVSKVSYLATKDLHLENRQRIPRAGNQSKRNKLPNEKPQKLEKSEDQSGLNLKAEEDESKYENSEEEDNSNQEGSESGSEDMKAESFKENESQDESQSQNGQSGQSQEGSESEDSVKQIKMEATCEKTRSKDKSKSSVQKKVTFFHRDQRTINLESQSEDN